MSKIKIDFDTCQFPPNKICPHYSSQLPPGFLKNLNLSESFGGWKLCKVSLKLMLCEEKIKLVR